MSAKDQSANQDAKEWMNATEATAYLGVSRATLYKLMDEGKLAYQNVKGVQKRKIRKSDLDALFEPSGQDKAKGSVKSRKSKRVP